ncbi:hypothetical protein HN51_032857 [Arachis hypogaea]
MEKDCKMKINHHTNFSKKKSERRVPILCIITRRVLILCISIVIKVYSVTSINLFDLVSNLEMKQSCRQMAKNLFSIGQMLEKDYVLHFEEDSCTINEKKKLKNF